MRLRTFGGLNIQGLPSGAESRRRGLVLLAVIAKSGTMGISREKLCAILWPDSDDVRARNALKQMVFAVRRDLKTPDVILGSTDLLLNPALISSDVGDFTNGISRGENDLAVSLYRGPFLDGIHIKEMPALEHWIETTRSQLATKFETVLRTLASNAMRAGEDARAVAYWHRLVDQVPHNSSAVIGLMLCLVATGDADSALDQAALYERMMRQGLELEPQPEVSALSREIRESRESREGRDGHQQAWKHFRHLTLG